MKRILSLLLVLAMLLSGCGGGTEKETAKPAPETVSAPEATEAEIQQAVYVSAMDEFLPSLPNGLDTVLGESGAGLSEGQAQRLAIARAILGGAPILLLDECTSALDADTEQKVLQRLKALPNRTCIAVTHRSAAMELCDWRLHVNDGKIIAEKIQ